MSFVANKSERASRARQILDDKIEKGRRSAAGVFERLHTDAPHDTVVRGGALRFRAYNVEGKDDQPTGQAGLAVGLGSLREVKIHPHALNQMGERAGIHTGYLSGLVSSEKDFWKVELAAHTLAQHYSHGDTSTAKYLARAVNGQMRGWLSDRYRRLDSRPLGDAFGTECQKLGAVPIDGTITDTRVAVKAILPTLFEPVPGEIIALGLEWHNSDFGAGMHSLRAFILRVLCLNGATMENALAQVHIGGRLSDEIEMSQRTYDLDTKTSISALRDTVSQVLAPEKVEALCAGIRSADEKEMDWRHLSTKLAKRLLKGELEAAKAAFEEEGAIDILPAGKTAWRASNVVSWLAGKADNPERKLELQRLAGEVLDGKADRVAA